MMVVVLSAAVGFLLALLRVPAWLLVPVAAFFGADAMLIGIVSGVPTETIALEVLGSMAARSAARQDGHLTFKQRLNATSVLNVPFACWDGREGMALIGENNRNRFP